MISFENISKQFRLDFWSRPFLALDDVSFQIPAEKVTGFLGANGAGKTTLIKVLMGLTKAQSGHIHFDERLGNSRKSLLSRLGYLPERPYFYPHLTGREFVTYLGQLNEIPLETIGRELGHWSERLNLAHALDRKIHHYSKGMLQRLGLISTFIHDPLVIILDEPLSGLDPVGRKEVKDAIVEVHQRGKTIFFSSHIIPDVEEICQSVVFLEKGRVLFEGSIDRLIRENIRPNFHIKGQWPQLSPLQTPCRLIARDGEAQTAILEVEQDKKEDLLREILQRGGRIDLLGQSKISLEEIFYKIKKAQAT